MNDIIVKEAFPKIIKVCSSSVNCFAAIFYAKAIVKKGKYIKEKTIMQKMFHFYANFLSFNGNIPF